jgi:hypothetical protein
VKGRTVLLFVVGCSILSSCAGPCYSRHQIIGRQPCLIVKTADVRCCLSCKQDKHVGTFSAAVAFLTTPFKNLGISGWTDYHLTATAIGSVVEARLSTDEFYTVDLKLESLRTGESFLNNVASKFMRLEIYRPSPSLLADIRQGKRMFATGKLVWDGDGHLEIHPQQQGDYKLLQDKN